MKLGDKMAGNKTALALIGITALTYLASSFTNKWIGSLLGLIAIALWFYMSIFEIIKPMFAPAKIRIFLSNIREKIKDVNKSNINKIKSIYDSNKSNFITYAVFAIFALILILSTNSQPIIITPPTPTLTATGEQTLFSKITIGLWTGASKTIGVLDNFIDKNFASIKEGMNKITGWFPRIDGPYLFEGSFWNIDNFLYRLLFFDALVIGIIIIIYLIIKFFTIVHRPQLKQNNSSQYLETSEIENVNKRMMQYIKKQKEFKNIFNRTALFSIVYFVGSGVPILNLLLKIITLEIIGTPFWIRAIIVSAAILFIDPYIEKFNEYNTEYIKYKKALKEEYLKKKAEI
ncbi:hypothetical protein J4423_00415 [Candidatus Pacearchaeota archaeon]|nr:hypothetical protein [Candidatus Pacearchaeota archaeon]